MTMTESEETSTREAIGLKVKKLDFGFVHSALGVVDVEFARAAFAIVTKSDNTTTEAIDLHR